MTRPKLLFLSHRLPYPPHNGASIRTYNILKQLSQRYDIHALCFDRSDPVTDALPLENRLAALRPFATVEVFRIPQEESSLRKVWDHLRSLLSGRAYTYYLHESGPFLQRARYLIAHAQFSLVHLDSLDLLRVLEALNGLPVVCTHHNVESALLRRRAAAESSVFRRWYIRLQANRLEREERGLIGTVALNIAVSADDRTTFTEMVPQARCEIIPNGVDVNAFRPLDAVQAGSVFVGGTTWFPNRDGLEWFVESILPELRELGWSGRVTWVGRAAQEELARYSDVPALHLTGYVEDIRPYVAAAASFIAPLRVGGGTRLKILDAWAMGKAVVSTSIGCEGLEAVDGQNLLIADTPREFAEAMVRLEKDRHLRGRLAAAGRQTVERLYSWDGLGARLRSLYQSLERPDDEPRS